MSKRKPICKICECKSTAWALTQKWGVTIVDYEDRKWLENYSWGLMNGERRSSYAHSSKLYRNEGCGYLHQLIMQTGTKIDHINSNGLDCRKINLRPATQRQNTHNTRSWKNASSQFKGVHLQTSSNKWITQIRINGQSRWVGRFSNEVDAAICYNIHALYYFGEFAFLNKIPSPYHHD